MALGDPWDVNNNDPLTTASRLTYRRRPGYSNFPGVNDFMAGNPSGSMTSLGPMFRPHTFNPSSSLSQVPVGGFGFGLGYQSRNSFDIFNSEGQETQAPTSRLPFVSGGYQFPAGTTLPSGFQENNMGGLTPRISPPSAPRYSVNPFVEGGYTFPAGSQLPEGFQESGGGGLTRQVPQDTTQSTLHFLPPGFTTAIGSTGVRGSTPSDIHFLPPGFTAFQGITGSNGQLQFQPPQKQDWGLGY